MKRIFLPLGCLLLLFEGYSQLTVQKGAGLYLQERASISIQGDVSADENISGFGILQLNGSGLQNINMNGFSVPNLKISNQNHIVLSGNASIARSLIFTDGKLQCGNYNLQLSEEGTINGAGRNNFIETNGAGNVHKLVSDNLSSYRFPIGNGSNYTPVDITTSGQYANAFIEISSRNGPSIHKPGNSKDYLNLYWPVRQTGIKGSAKAIAYYEEVSGVSGNGINMKGLYWDGNAWNSTGACINALNKEISADLSSPDGEIYAMSFRDLPSAKLIPVISVMPNPALNNTTLKIEMPQTEKGIVYITDAGGKIIYKSLVYLQKGIQHKNLSLMGFAKGYYDIHVESLSMKSTVKLIKQ